MSVNVDNLTLPEVSGKLRRLYHMHKGGKLGKEQAELMDRLEERFRVLIKAYVNGSEIVSPPDERPISVMAPEAFEEWQG